MRKNVIKFEETWHEIDFEDERVGVSKSKVIQRTPKQFGIYAVYFLIRKYATTGAYSHNLVWIYFLGSSGAVRNSWRATTGTIHTCYFLPLGQLEGKSAGIPKMSIMIGKSFFAAYQIVHSWHIEYGSRENMSTFSIEPCWYDSLLNSPYFSHNVPKRQSNYIIILVSRELGS